MVRRLDDGRDGAGVLQDPLDLRGRAGLVDRHHDRAGVEEREVHQCPLVRGAGEEAHLLAGLDPRGDEPLRERDHGSLEVGRGDVAPPGAVRNREEGEARCLLDALDQEVGDVRLRVRGNDRGDFELDHGNSFGTGRVLSSQESMAIAVGIRVDSYEIQSQIR
ncbi:hypothetical protein ABE10_12510 [Bacillus toyonensis]|nr:hypothetical protein [Bacillus toyonensis]